MSEETKVNKKFYDFAQKNGEYYSKIFSLIRNNKLKFYHINFSAVLGGFFWSALRGNWFLFFFSSFLDLIAAVNVTMYFKYGAGIEKAILDDKGFLVERYTNWQDRSFIYAILVFVLGRILIGWLADRFYIKQYDKWQINNKNPSGFSFSRLINVFLVLALIWPLTLYRSSQFAPDERTCIKQHRAMEKGQEISFKKRFDCFFISEFPILLWIDRPIEISYPRDEDGKRYIKRKKPRADLPTITLNKFVSQKIEESVLYLTAFHGYVFDGATAVIRSILKGISAVFVGTPWIITGGIFLLTAYKVAGFRVTAFVGFALVYLAMFGFWNTAMDTMALVITATLICCVIGLPLGILVGKSNRAEAITRPILDVMQTIPSFVYLIPAVAFFSVGKPPGIIATVIFAMPPIVRLTALGIRQVPSEIKEAALAFGSTERQLLYSIELPLALPTIMAGINQVVMMCLSMVVIAALIGAGGMGLIVVEALANTRIGRGILAGLAIAFIAMIIDRVVQKASKQDQNN